MPGLVLGTHVFNSAATEKDWATGNKPAKGPLAGVGRFIPGQASAVIRPVDHQEEPAPGSLAVRRGGHPRPSRSGVEGLFTQLGDDFRYGLSDNDPPNRWRYQ